jgi:DNA-binding response OmpR family regulator
MANIFLVDNDALTTDSLQPVLTREGHRLTVYRPCIDTLRRLVLEQPDLVILGVDAEDHGWEFCRQLLSFATHPVLLLLASGNELDRVHGLELGAADCLLKPFLILELIARVRALLRREAIEGPRAPQSSFVDGNLAVNLGRREVRLNGNFVPLSATEYRLLACFIQHVDEVLPVERLLTLVWGGERSGGEDHVKLYVHHLRRKLEADPAHPVRLLTRRGQGYLFQRLEGQPAWPAGD